MRKKYAFTGVMLLVVLLLGMGLTQLLVSGTGEREEEFTIVTSFYPMYIATENVIAPAEHVTLKNLSEPQTGCLHDFQLTPEDMKLLGTADVFVINGGGIESFMEEIAETYPDLTVIEACADVELLSDEEHGEHDEAEQDGHEHEHEENAHAWMSVAAYETQVQTIADGLAAADPARSADYEQGAADYRKRLAPLRERQQAIREQAAGTPVILFHEAYAYIAEDYGLSVQLLLDLDEERQVSAGEVSDVLSAVKDGGVSYILAEELYGKSLGDTVEAEADVSVLYLDPLNRGDYDADSYLNGMEKNIEILEAALCKK